MELLLNFLWLMLALPAVLVWRQHSVSTRSSARRSHSRSFVLLGCLLALLFPVVSASDDLHPISAEIEESGPSKRTIKQSPVVKSPVWTYAVPLMCLTSLQPENEAFGTISEYLPVFPQFALVIPINDRAPPET